MGLLGWLGWGHRPEASADCSQGCSPAPRPVPPGAGAYTRSVAATDAGPDPFRDAFLGLIGARALTTATALGVFDALAEAPAGPYELAERLGLDPLGADTLLSALAALGYLEREAAGYRPSIVAGRLLVRSSPESIATFVGAQSELHWDVLAGLGQGLRTGEPYALHESRREEPVWEGYIRGLYEISRAEQDENAALVPVEDPVALLDVAGGHGAFAMAMCRRHPRLRATVLELASSAAVGRRIVAGEGYADRVEFREGDVFETDMGSDLDVVSAFNLFHHLSAERVRELCSRAREALRPGGAFVVGDSQRPEPGEERSQVGALSALLFYAWSHGRTFTAAELRGFLSGAGFADVELHRNERSPWRVLAIGRA